MPNAARILDPIGHSPTMNWLVKGLLIGAAVGIAAVAIVGTGGLAAVAVVGGLAAGGAGIGEVLSTMSWAGKEKSGQIQGVCSPNVSINGRLAARAHLDLVVCDKHSGQPPIAEGSGNVYINGMPAARIGDHTGCGGVITDASPNVFIGGGTQQTDTINPENLVPPWVHVALFAVGIASALILAGPFAAILGTAGAIGGGMLGSYIGGKVFGEGSDGQKWTMLGGSLLGGFAGGKGGAALDQRYVITSEGLGANGGNIRIRPRNPDGTFQSQPTTGDVTYNRASQYPHASPPSVRSSVIDNATMPDGTVVDPQGNVIPPDQVTIEHNPAVVDHWNSEGYNQTQSQRNTWYNDQQNLSVMSKSQNSSEGANMPTYRQDVGPNYKP